MAALRHRATRLNRAVGIVARLAVLTLVLGITSVATPQATAAPAPPIPGPAPAPEQPPAKASCPGDIGPRTVVLLVHGYASSEEAWGENAFSKLCDTQSYVTTFNYGHPEMKDQDPSLMWVDDQRIGPDLAARIAELSKQSKTQGGTGKVLLVAHSMGGLAIRCALDSECNNLNDDETSKLVSNVGMVVTFGTPNLGSFLRKVIMGKDAATAEWRADLLTRLCLAAPIPGLAISAGDVEFLTHYCAHLKAFANGPASSSFTPGIENGNLTTLAKLPVSVPVVAVAGSVQSKTTLFFHTTNRGDLGDLVLDKESAHAQVRPGTSDVALTVDCGNLNFTLLDLNAMDVIGITAPKYVMTAEFPSCSHISEPNDDRFLNHAKQAIDKWINDNILATPTGLTAEPLSATSVRLSWNDVSSNEDGFRITVNGAPSPDALASNTKTTEVPGLKAETKYCFTVEAFKSAVKSAPSAQACATPGDPRLEGDWLLSRTLQSCINFSEGCAATPIPVRFDSCTASQCTISRTDGIWQSSHPITLRAPDEWKAEFNDIGVACYGKPNPADLVMSLEVSSTETSGGILRATTIGGTYSVHSTINPPDCEGDATAVWSIAGER